MIQFSDMFEFEKLSNKLRNRVS